MTKDLLRAAVSASTTSSDEGRKIHFGPVFAIDPRYVVQIVLWGVRGPGKMSYIEICGHVYDLTSELETYDWCTAKVAEFRAANPDIHFNDVSFS